ncbi:UNVERIFIED_CONTAM: hypothetical protein Slati_0960400 [Sesamum latifolium]|uniref:Uncharacterized protein n=1 Tax=Sesamum latifolium TaxID=2727402 RepID=A0AAW2XTH8_9LAMI
MGSSGGGSRHDDPYEARGRALDQGTRRWSLQQAVVAQRRLVDESFDEEKVAPGPGSSEAGEELSTVGGEGVRATSSILADRVSSGTWMPKD